MTGIRDLQAGSQLGDYRIVSRGGGGFGGSAVPRGRRRRRPARRAQGHRRDRIPAHRRGLRGQPARRPLYLPGLRHRASRGPCLHRYGRRRWRPDAHHDGAASRPEQPRVLAFALRTRRRVTGQGARGGDLPRQSASQQRHAALVRHADDPGLRAAWGRGLRRPAPGARHSLLRAADAQGLRLLRDPGHPGLDPGTSAALAFARARSRDHVDAAAGVAALRRYRARPKRRVSTSRCGCASTSAG